MLKKILKWTGLVLLTLIVALAVITTLRQDLRYSAPYPEIKASGDSAVIARGRHLVTGPAHCINCHSTQNADSLLNQGLPVSLSGGVAFNLPLETIYSRNITPDKETGIGQLTDAEIARALRYGVHPNGRPVFDFMPFHNTSDEDLAAIISYLRAQQPVKNKVPAHSLNMLGKMVNAFMVKPVGPTGKVPATVKRDTSSAYGRYLALSVAECNGCHTQRDMSGAFTGEPFAGSASFEAEKPYLAPPNLTPDSSSRIFGWTKQDFIKRFRIGKIVKESHMPWEAFGRMDDAELTAIYNYLHTLKPVRTPLKG